MTEKKDKVTDISTRKKRMTKKEKEELEYQKMVEEQMRKDEEELDNRLRKYAEIAPQIDNSSVTEEEDEEEGEFVIDLNSGVITQVTEEIFIAGELEFAEVKADPGMEYGNFIRDLLVRKAVAKLLRETREEGHRVQDEQERAPGYLSESYNTTIKEIENRRIMLTKSIRGNKVHYEDLPEWAKTYIFEYIESTLGNLLIFGEE